MGWFWIQTDMFFTVMLTSVILRKLPLAFEPRSKKKRLCPALTICPPVSVSVMVGGDGPGPTTVLLPATAA